MAERGERAFGGVPVLQRSTRLFASAPGERRVRRPIDAAIVLAALAALAALALWALPIRPFEQSLVAAAAATPPVLRGLLASVYDVVVALPLALLAAAVVRRRWPIAIQSLAAAAAAVVLAALTIHLVDGTSASLREVAGLGSGSPWPGGALAFGTAALLAASSDVTRPWRTFGTRAVAVGAVAAVLSGRLSPSATVGALLIATAAAAAARLAIGTTAGRLSAADVRRLLDALGVLGDGIEGLDRGADGIVLARSSAADGTPVLVKVHGRDAAESRRVHRWWRVVISRDGGVAVAQSRSAALEREAVITLLAERHGVPVRPVEAWGRPDGVNEALVLRRLGARATELDPATLDDAFAARAWAALDALHDARAAHLAVSPATLVVRDDGGVALTDLVDAMLPASPQALATDDAQLLVTLAVLLGPERALATTRAALDDERIAALLPYVQPAALPRDLRVAARAGDLDTDAFRASVATALERPEPELVRLRRLTWGSVIRTGLLMLAAAAILPMLANIDRGQMRTAMETATWALVVVGFFVAQTTRVAQAVSTLGAVPARLPFGPVYMMQLATSFLNIALPSAAARMALSVRFFQRQGIGPATSITSGLIDSFVGNVVQVIALTSLLLFTSLSLGVDVDVSGPDSESQRLLVVLLLVLALTVGAAAAVGRIRRPIVEKLRAWLPGVRAAVAPLRDPHKLLQLIGGNVAAELLFAIALALFVYAFGGSISLTEALLVNMSASLLVSFIPVPGGIGIAEGAMIVGLTNVGVDEETAFAATIFCRLSTFYLPPIWGWFAMRWLSRNRYL